MIEALVAKFGEALILWLISGGAEKAAKGEIVLPEGLDISDIHRVRDAIPDPLPNIVLNEKFDALIAKRKQALAAAAEMKPIFPTEDPTDAAAEDKAEQEALDAPFGGILKQPVKPE